MHLFFSVGEPSGDQHAAHVVEALRKRMPDAKFSGLGGPEMEAAGVKCIYPLTDLAVVGFLKVLPMVWQFFKVYRQAKAYLQQEKPDAVVLVDFPGFNWWIASAAKKLGIPVYFYCPPQLWAWGPWRIRKVRKYVDCVLSVLPFEAEWYHDRGIDCEYVGHPFFDEVANHELDHETISSLRSTAPMTVGILPGSRKQEVNLNFPVMLDHVAKYAEKYPNVHFPVACYRQWHYDRCTEILAERDDTLPVQLHLNKTSEIIEASEFCIMVSGSVSLELLARNTPAAVIYRGSWALYVMAKLLITCKYMSLPNLIVDGELMPELPFVMDRGKHIDAFTDRVERWFLFPSELQVAQAKITKLAADIVRAGGIEAVANVLHQRLTGTELSEQEPVRRAA